MGDDTQAMLNGDEIPDLPDEIEAQVETAAMPDNWEGALKALEECATFDEVEEWENEHAALLSYARQARDTRMRDHVESIRLRALGKVLERYPVKQGERADLQPLHTGEQKLSRSGVAKAHGISRRKRAAAIGAVTGKQAAWLKKPRKKQRLSPDHQLYAEESRRIENALSTLTGQCNHDYLAAMSLDQIDSALECWDRFIREMAELRERFASARAERESAEVTPPPALSLLRRRPMHTNGRA